MLENCLFVGFKPRFISSNQYLNTLKKKFGIKKIGYSGTLDPFASGVLVCGTGNATRLFNHINLEPKIYRATLWLGAKSDTLDILGDVKTSVIKEFRSDEIARALDLNGDIAYIPPSFSAKKINGIRAYKLAREGKNPILKESIMHIFYLKILFYNHPFLSFEVALNKGSFVRSLGEIIAKNLGVSGILSNLIRIKEGDFGFENFKILNPLDFIKYPRIAPKIKIDSIKNGEKFRLENELSGMYLVNFDEFFSIIRVNEKKEVEYILNRMKKC